MRIKAVASPLLPVMLFSVALLAPACCDPESDQIAAAGDPRQPEADQTITGAEAFHGLLPYRARDAKLALVQPSFVDANEAHLVDGVSVVGVMANGSFRAYPLYVLKNHQVVNDRLGDVPIAASW